MANYSQALKEAYASAPVEQVILDTLEIYHPAFIDDEGHPAPARVVRAYEDLFAVLEVTAPMNPGQQVRFQAMAFDFVLPGFEEGKTPELKITLDNVGRELVGYLEAAASDPTQVTVIYRPYLISDLTGPQMDPPITMLVTGVSLDVFQVQISASLDDVNNWAFPHRLYQPADFPGLVR
ncbi:DUF1833 family protein [Luteibacter sp. NPDC031894]|uniref:DUF1833 family protein n=1 Tax=Luteibacter sp. NPDC031894 TaxID=3390572 RepID=UPI003D00E96B